MSTDHIPPFYRRYINLVDSQLLAHTLRENGQSMSRFLKSWSSEMIDYRYAEGKWTAREVVQHLIDSERIFAYRALRFARMDQSDLPGFNENEYAEVYNEDKRPFGDVIEEMEAVRASTVSLFAGFSPHALKRTGTASGVTMSVRTIGEVIAGHELHHKNILIERYFPDKG